MADHEGEEILRIVARAAELGLPLPDHFVVFRPGRWSGARGLLAAVIVGPAFLGLAALLVRYAWREGNWGGYIGGAIFGTVGVGAAMGGRANFRQLFGRDESNRNILVVTKDRVVRREDGTVSSHSLVEAPFAFQVRSRKGISGLFLGRAPFERSTPLPVVDFGDGYDLDEVEAAINAARLKRVMAGE